MSIREFWRGTPEELEAKAQVAKLNTRASRGGKLSVSQKRALETNDILARRISRRRFIISGAAFTGAIVATVADAKLGGLFWGGDQEGSNASAPQYSTATPLLSTSHPEDWRSLPAKERIQRLWGKGAVEAQNFNSLDEFTFASAEIYCQETVSSFTPEQLASRTFYISDTHEYYRLMIEHGIVNNDLGLEEEDLIKLLEGQSTAHVSKDGGTYVNLGGLEEKIDLSSANSEIAHLSSSTNVLFSLINYNLLHEYGHHDENKFSKTLDKPIVISSSNGFIEIREIEGLDVKAFFRTDEFTGVQKIACAEPLVDARAFEMAESLGNKTLQLIHTPYEFGRQWVVELNRFAGISTEDFEKYVTGRLPLEGLFIRWGGITPIDGLESSDPKDVKLEKGLSVYVTVGLQTSGRIDTDIAYRYIGETLFPQIQIPLGTPLQAE